MEFKTSEFRPAIIWMHEKGESKKKIAELLGISRHAVRDAIKRFEETGSNANRKREKTARSKKNILRAKTMNKRNPIFVLLLFVLFCINLLLKMKRKQGGPFHLAPCIVTVESFQQTCSVTASTFSLTSGARLQHSIHSCVKRNEASILIPAALFRATEVP